MYSLLLGCWKMVFVTTSIFSWRNSVILRPASLCTLAKLACFSWYRLIPTFAIHKMKRTNTMKNSISSRRCCRSSQNQSASASTSMVGAWSWITVMLNGLLGNEPRSLYQFWDCTQLLHFRLFCWPWGLLHFMQVILAHSSRYNSHLN